MDVEGNAGTTAPPAENGRSAPAAVHVAGVVEAAARLADAQVRLWLAEVRRTAGRMILAGAYCLLGLILALAAVAFLYAGVFHFLTDYLRVPTAWALVIFAGVHGLAAGALVVLALTTVRRGLADFKGEKQ